MKPGSFLPVLYEDDDLLILHKFSGIPSVPHSQEETGTAVHSALARFPDLKNVGDKPLEPGALHRLDTGTSGVLAFAKNKEEFQRLREAWKKHQIKKIYRACVDLQAPPPSSTPLRIDCPIAHDAKSSKKMIALAPGKKIHSNRIRGRPREAVTWIHRTRLITPQAADFEIEIETGVLHQIRCHLAAFHWPILGDPIYQKPQKTAKRLWLHAWKLAIPLKEGATLVIQANLPEDWPENGVSPV